MKNKVLFLADFFSDDLLGGAESNDSVLLDFLKKENFQVEKKHCRNLTIEYLSSLNKDIKIIISNFVSLSEQNKSYIAKNCHYIIYEHDHKYVSTRDPSKFTNFKIPENKILNREFYENASNIIVMSDICKKVLEENLSLSNIINIGTSLWTKERLTLIEGMIKKEKKKECAVVDSENPIKGKYQALAWCKNNNIQPDLISSKNEEEFLEILSNYEKLIFVPQVLETFNRLCAEAKMLECKVVTNKKLLGFASEESFKLSGKDLIEETRKRVEKALQIFSNLLKQEIQQKMNIVSYKRLYKEIDILCHKIASSNIRIDAVVPALRSGMIPAYKIAERLNLPIMIEEKLYGGLRLSYDRNIENILLVDDSINTGTNLKNELEKYRKKYNIYTCAVIASNYHKNNINFYATVVETPRVFEWNMFNSANTSKIMFDMDGVICIDPRVYDDDGEKYENEIKSIPHLFVPKYPIHSIVTNRIERWRSVTEEWLKVKSVKYGKLVMQQFETAVERRRKSDPGEYKAKHYKDSDAVLFIESDLLQATKIFKISQKPVFCIESNNFFGVD